ncbi:MAG: LysM peptidoglycan-binding domain-containing protein [Clostridiales bacterium]|nr:LysM peptidoglycan-binding domain-containing protein [Clostridiales bacterium]
MSTTNSNATCSAQYTVKRGDSFYLIAHRLGIQLRDLLEANPDIPPSRLTVGDVLCIPYSNEAQNPGDAGGNQTGNQENTPDNNQGNGNPTICPPCPECPSDETPEQPETPENICPPNRRTVVQNGQTASDLQLRYDLSYYTLQTANADKNLDELKGGDVICVPETNLPCNLPTTYTLRENESLESIAVTYNLPIASLLRVNPCLAPEDFAAGVTIRLPN